MKVRIDDWHAVAYWHWDVKDPDDLCGICQNAFDGVCGTCKEPGDGCPLLFGECTHVFHLHCIMKWLDQDKRTTCPMCKRKWIEAVAETEPHKPIYDHPGSFGTPVYSPFVGGPSPTYDPGTGPSGLVWNPATNPSNPVPYDPTMPSYAPSTTYGPATTYNP